MHRLTAINRNPGNTRAARGDVRLEYYPFAVRGKAGLGIFQTMSQLERVFAVDVDPPQMLASGAVGNENDIAAVRTDRGLFVETGTRCELPGRAALEISEPQILFATGLQRIYQPMIRRPREAIRSVIVREGKLRTVVDVTRRRNPDRRLPFRLDCQRSSAIRRHTEIVVVTQVISDLPAGALRIRHEPDLLSRVR